jgi:hypothetical protein
LIEVLVATAVLVVSILMATSVAASAQRLSRSCHEKDAALRALDAEVMAIESTAFDQIQGQHDGRDFAVLGDGQVNNMLPATAGDADNLPGEVIVVNAAGAAPGTLLQVTVRVDWQGVAGPQSMMRTVLLSELGQSG